MTNAPTGIKTANRPMIAAVVASVGASVCCVGPLVLLALGIGGTWISSLTAMEPYRPVFIGITLVFLFMAFRNLYLVPAACAPGDACAVPTTRHNQRLVFWVVTVLLIALLTFPYYGTVFFA